MTRKKPPEPDAFAVQRPWIAWLASKTRVEDLGTALNVPELSRRSGWVYAGCLIVRERGADERLIFAAAIPWAMRIGRHEFIVSHPAYWTTERRLFEWALANGYDTEKLPDICTSRACQRCCSTIPVEAKVCRNCGARQRHVHRPMLASPIGANP